MKLNTLLLLLVSGITAAYANATDDYSSTYFDLGAGFGVIQNLPTGAITGSAAVGYQFNRYFGIEANWDGMPSQQWDKLYNYNIYSLSVKGILPLTNNFELYGKLGSGVGYSTWTGTTASSSYSSSGSATAWNEIIGIGATFKLSPHFNLYLENKTFFPLTNPPGRFSTANATTFGFQFNFSAPTPNNTSETLSSLPTISTQSQPQTIQLSPPAVTNIKPTNAPATMVIPPQLNTSEPAPVVNERSEDMTYSRNFSQRILIHDGRKYIVIHKDDTLFSISRESRVTEAQLRTINHLQNNLIKLGSRLYLN